MWQERFPNALAKRGPVVAGAVQTDDRSYGCSDAAAPKALPRAAEPEGERIKGSSKISAEDHPSEMDVVALFRRAQQAAAAAAAAASAGSAQGASDLAESASTHGRARQFAGLADMAGGERLGEMI